MWGFIVKVRNIVLRSPFKLQIPLNSCVDRTRALFWFWLIGVWSDQSTYTWNDMIYVGKIKDY